MARTQVRSQQVEDGGVRRVDLNTATSGSAVITKAVQGTGIGLSSTGADAGTGDVTISVSMSAALDQISSTRGVVLYRGASAWSALSPGASGQVLTSNGAGADPSWTSRGQSMIDAGNSSTTPLSAGSTFTGTGLSVLGYGSVSVLVAASHESAVDGLAIEQSSDNSNYDIADYCDIKAGQTQVINVNLVAEYYRVVLVNGGTNQTTLRLESRLNPSPIVTKDGGRSDIPAKSAVATLTGTGDSALVAAPGANKSLVLRRISSYNTSATLTRVDVKDGSTVFKYLAAAASGGGEVYETRKLLTENTALNVALSVGVTDVRISGEYVVVKS